MDIINAVSNGDRDTVVDLLSQGVDPNTTDESGNTLLHLAVQSNQLKVLNVLLRSRKVDSTIRNQNGDTAIVLAMKLGNRDLVSKIYQAMHFPAHYVHDKDIIVDYDSSLGVGGITMVYQGTFHGQKVAVKESKAGDEDFKQEIKMMELCRSPYFVELIAVSDIYTTHPKMALEFMDSGSLEGHINALREGKPTKLKVTTLEVAWILANAIYDLHHAGIIHRDIKSSSILLSSDKYIKLGGIGNGREWGSRTNEGLNAVFSMAPEVFSSDGHYSTASDIYSFGVVLTELDTLELPYANLGLSPFKIFDRIRRGKLAPKISSNCEPWLQSLIEHCLSFDPNKRPTAKEVIDILQNRFPNLHEQITE
ncbi:kinase [Thraustotheca clavata]|uniref:Kinase n=1 Tax=Thraustotheca clavata TaxID=74557 RepID=A0A1V9YPK9_9STRA|nr:kinase [Thraustotheca clavata]